MAVVFRCPRQNGRSELCPARKLFSCLTPAQAAALGRERLARCFGPGQVLIHRDTPALAVHAIHSGRVKLTRVASNGDVALVGLRGAGELLGLREVLAAMPYQASVVTLEPSIVCTVPREAFHDAIRDSHELAARLLRQLAEDALSTEQQLVARVHLTVPVRTARLLLALTDQGGGSPKAGTTKPVAASREEIALRVGTTRESLSRALHQFAARGALRLEEGAIRVVDRSLLERLSQRELVYDGT
jgi:CRP/FNR family transcriptional regulator